MKFLNLFLALVYPFAAAANDSGSGTFVIGGTGGTGLEIVKLLRQQGDEVTVLARKSSNTGAVEEIGARLVVGDALDRDSLDAALRQGSYRMVISTIGGRTQDGGRVDGVGNINMIEATKAAGISRFLLISSIGAGDSYNALTLITKQALAASIKAKTEAENHLIDSGLNYTIIRPGGLFDGELSGQGILTEDRSTSGSIARSELALLTVACINDDETIGKIYAAVEKWD
jgi:uncharacterized protein YbjT (DUF2867 family)